jgi:peptide methionine sulfoxide reductase msrA/msrB
MQRVVMLGLGLIAIILIGLNFSVQSATQTPKLEAAAVQKDMPATKQLETIVLGAGCFWGAEKRYEAIPGVLDAVSGYADGNGIKPTYDAITQPQHKLDPNNYAEVVQVTFNPTIVSLEAILQNYFEGHDPTQLNRQGNDIGTQYRSTILVQNQTQQQQAEQVKAQYQQLLSAAGYGQIATVIKPLSKFYPAERYHQDYIAKNPDGYCPDHSTGIKFAAVKTESPVDNQPLQQGKQIVVIESEGCPYCEKFRKDVTSSYQGDISIHSRRASQLVGLTIKTPTWATPTILFLENGSEVFGHQGYLSSEEFYRALGLWKRP